MVCVLTWLQGCDQLVDVLTLLLARRYPSLRRPHQHQQPLLQLLFSRFQSIAILVGDVGAPKLRSMGTGRVAKQWAHVVFAVTGAGCPRPIKPCHSLGACNDFIVEASVVSQQTGWGQVQALKDRNTAAVGVQHRQGALCARLQLITLVRIEST